MSPDSSRPVDETLAPDASDETKLPAAPPSRRELIRAHEAGKARSRPYVIGAVVLLSLILIIPTVAFVLKFVIPPRQLAVQVEDKIYTRGDVVNFIRFNQRLSEELGVTFKLGSSLFEALQTISENEIAFQAAPKLGITVEPYEIDDEIRRVLGFASLAAEATFDGETQGNFEERKRQFLNNVGLAEEVWRDIVRKDIFRQKVREAVAGNVSRIQPQVHLYKIGLALPDPAIEQQISRRLTANESIESIARDISVDPDVGRNNGEVGWFPEGVNDELNFLMFGMIAEGERVLPIGELSEPQFDSETRLTNIFYIDELAEAREVNAEAFEVLKDQALGDFLNKERRDLFVQLKLNDRIYNWVNSQVHLNSLLPTPTPASGFPGLRGLTGG